MENVRKCSNCKNRMFHSYAAYPIAEYCYDYELATTEEEEIEAAKECTNYEFGNPDCLENQEEYRPSATNRDYSPSNPWDAPGMSIHDFI